MKIIYTLLLSLTAFFSCSLSLTAQSIQYSQDQIVGKWILKSASYNGLEVSLADIKDRISFEFSVDGKVIYNTPNGTSEEGVFLLKENKIVDPQVPEYPNADIISLTQKDLIIEVWEADDNVLMTFELER